ncbi:hypothetical protein KJ359_012778 [Pestalotiopsis sp. 9143b]|nr:hypothetical protein KJ359_012778 [Pestalotiopsis sp. 9143b]
MSAPEPRYLLAEDVTNRVFIHEGRVWCALLPAGQRHEPVLEVFLEELDEEEGPLDDHLNDVVDDEGSTDAEKGHEGANRDS